MKKKLLANKFAVAGLASLGSVAAFAEGATPSASTTPGEIANLFTPWIASAATALVTLLTAGVAIVGIMYVWRLLKRAFGSSK